MANESDPRPESPSGEDWERGVLTQLAYAGLEEQRRGRRWGIFFKGLGFAYLFALLALFMVRIDGADEQTGPHTALVELSGLIAQDGDASADDIVAGLRAAFEDEDTAGIILRINSPGGTPVQAAYVYDEIRRLREAYPDTPFYAVISDLCASGGYYIAAAADEIYANEASLIGSIGVRMDSFGFVEAMDKLGVERRLLTAGEHKALLDPFLPVDEVSQAHLQDQLDEIHAQFISAVQQGRGDRLADDPSIYSGLIWTGTQAQELGLIDAFGSAGFVAREVIGAERIVEFGGEESLLERFARDLGASAGGVLLRGLTQPSLN